MQAFVLNTTDASGGAKDSDIGNLDPWSPGPYSVQVVVTGTVNYSVQVSNDDPNDPHNPVAAASITWFDSSDTNLVGATGSKIGFFTTAPRSIRLHQASGSGSCVMTVVQNGVVPL